MFNATHRAKLASLVREAANNPMDLRDLADPAKAAQFAEMMVALSVTIGALKIALSHDRMPPDWRPYRHLSVSQSGRKPSAGLFLQVAREVGMGDPYKWNSSLVVLIEQRMPVRMNARHAFQAIVN